MAKKKYWECPIDVPLWRESPSRYEFSLAERGLYLEMLLYQWLEGSCPTDAAKLAKVCAVSVEEVEACLPAVEPKFRRGGNRYVNEKLEEVRASRVDKRSQSSPQNGTKGGRPRKPNREPNQNLTETKKDPILVVRNSNSDFNSCSPEDFQATLETLKDEHPGSYHADDCGRALSNLTGKGHALEDILIAHRNAQKAWATGRIPPDLEKWLWTYSPDNKLVGFDSDKKPKSALAAMKDL